jgi:hypothetical protein
MRTHEHPWLHRSAEEGEEQGPSKKQVPTTPINVVIKVRQVAELKQRISDLKERIAELNLEEKECKQSSTL